MINAFSNITITKDISKDLIKSLDELASKVVCVGIPQEEDKNRGKDGIKNAELLYIHTHGVRDKTMIKEMQHDLNTGTPYSEVHELYVHEHGSPLWNSPPRPVLEPALENSKDLISEQMKKAINAALDGGDVQIEIDKVGQIGENAAKDWFTNPENKWPVNSKETVKRKGSDNPLIDTGELRKSIKYVIRDVDEK